MEGFVGCATDSNKSSEAHSGVSNTLEAKKQMNFGSGAQRPTQMAHTRGGQQPAKM